MPPSKTSDKAADKPVERTYRVELFNDIEYQGVIYKKGSNVEVPRGLAILQGAIEPDPTPDVTALAPEDVQSQVQTHLNDLVTRLTDSERNYGVLQTQLTAVQGERDSLAAQVVEARQERDTMQAAAQRLEADNAQYVARITGLEQQIAASTPADNGPIDGVKTETGKAPTGITSDPNKAPI